MELVIFPFVLVSCIHAVLVVAIIESLKAMLFVAIQIVAVYVLVWLLVRTKKNVCEYCKSKPISSWVKLDEIEHGFCGIICISWWIRKQTGYRVLNIQLTGGT